MGKLCCPCGNALSDVTDDLPYKAYLRTDQDIEQPLDEMAQTIVGLLAARERGEEGQYLAQVYRKRGYRPEGIDLLVSDMEKRGLAVTVAEILYAWWNQHERTMWECGECGRLLVQRGPGIYEFKPYLPESQVRGILRPQGGEVPEAEE